MPRYTTFIGDNYEIALPDTHWENTGIELGDIVRFTIEKKGQVSIRKHEVQDLTDEEISEAGNLARVIDNTSGMSVYPSVHRHFIHCDKFSCFQVSVSSLELEPQSTSDRYFQPVFHVEDIIEQLKSCQTQSWAIEAWTHWGIAVSITEDDVMDKRRVYASKEEAAQKVENDALNFHRLFSRSKHLKDNDKRLSPSDIQKRIETEFSRTENRPFLENEWPYVIDRITELLDAHIDVIEHLLRNEFYSLRDEQRWLAIHYLKHEVLFNEERWLELTLIGSTGQLSSEQAKRCHSITELFSELIRFSPIAKQRADLLQPFQEQLSRQWDEQGFSQIRDAVIHTNRDNTHNKRFIEDETNRHQTTSSVSSPDMVWHIESLFNSPAEPETVVLSFDKAHIQKTTLNSLNAHFEGKNYKIEIHEKSPSTWMITISHRQ